MGFRVTVAKNNLHFAASHFITYGGKCEFLHGHNYSLTIDIDGPLTEDSYVFDFVALKKIARSVSETLDHRFLLAADNPHLGIKHENGYYQVDYKENCYRFPEKDVKPLPVDNITAERLAEYIWGKVAEEICNLGPHQLASMTIGVEEAEGQVAYFNQAFSQTGRP